MLLHSAFFQFCRIQSQSISGHEKCGSWQSNDYGLCPCHTSHDKRCRLPSSAQNQKLYERLEALPGLTPLLRWLGPGLAGPSPGTFTGFVILDLASDLADKRYFELNFGLAAASGCVRSLGRFVVVGRVCASTNASSGGGLGYDRRCTQTDNTGDTSRTAVVGIKLVAGQRPPPPSPAAP